MPAALASTATISSSSATRTGCAPRSTPWAEPILARAHHSRKPRPMRSAGVPLAPRGLKTSGDGITKATTRKTREQRHDIPGAMAVGAPSQPPATGGDRLLAD